MNIDLALEQQILSTLITYPDAIRHVDGLKASAFSEEIHRNIYAEIIRLAAENEKISPVKLTMVADSKYISGLVTQGTLLDLRGAADVLTELASRREIELLLNSAKLAIESGASSSEALSLLHPLSSGEILESKTRKMMDSGKVTQQVLDDLLLDKKPFSTGILPIDEAMGGGMYPGKAYGVAARKKVGKTIMLGTVSHNLNMAGVKHLFICGEMGQKEIQQRVLCRALDMYPSAFRSGYAKRQEVVDSVRNYLKSAPKNAIYLDTPGITFDALKRAVVDAKMRYDIKGFILDYWQLVGGKGGKDSEAFHLGEVAQWIAEIGRKLDIFSLTAAQINQDGNTRGGEGMRLAFDQVYHLQPVGENGGDVTLPGRWLEMMDTRYTSWANIGNENMEGLTLNERGLFFEVSDNKPYYSMQEK